MVGAVFGLRLEDLDLLAATETRPIVSLAPALREYARPDGQGRRSSSRATSLVAFGHAGWVFSGVSTFEAGATTFLAQGAARGERQMFLADDPVVGQWPNDLVDRGELVIASVTDIYGPDRMVEAASQRGAFATVLAEALSEGYTGIKVVADNELIDTPERLQAWLAWEEVADRFMAENPVTGLCAFDRTRVEAATLSEVMGSHHVSMSD